MKLECSIVKELYVLYEAQEMSPDIKKAVEEHLNNCPDCTRFYQNSYRLPDISSLAETQPSQKLDEKMSLKLKVSRLKAGVIFILAVFLLFINSNYNVKRQNLISDYIRIANDISYLEQELRYMENAEFPPNKWPHTLLKLNDQFLNLERNLNFLEKGSLREIGQIDINTNYNNLLIKFVERALNGNLKEKDRKVVEIQGANLRNAVSIIRMEADRVSAAGALFPIGKYFSPSKLKEVKEAINRINETSLLYTMHDSLPGEISAKTEKELYEIAKIKVDTEGYTPLKTINFSLGGNGQGHLTFQGSDGREVLNVTLDGYTGRLIDLGRVFFDPPTSGELLPVESVQEKSLELIKRAFGEGTYEVVYMGENYGTGRGDGSIAYTFHIYSKYKGIRLAPYAVLYYDGRSGKLLHGFMHNFENLQGSLSLSENFDHVEALENAAKINSRYKDYKYMEKLIIKSMVYGSYEVVYRYEKDNRPLFINARTGLIERMAY
jgi:hypothetical protein